jgi:hypothetical protein
MATESMMQEELQTFERSHHHRESFNARIVFLTVLVQGNLVRFQIEIHPFLEVEILRLVAVLPTEENLHLVEIEIQNHSPRTLVQGRGIPSKGIWRLETWEVQGIWVHQEDLETWDLSAQETWDPEIWDRPVDPEIRPVV